MQTRFLRFACQAGLWTLAIITTCFTSGCLTAVSYAGVLNLIYDAMPSDFVTLIVTEFGLIPPTSVPVILREYRQEPAL